MKQVVNYSGLFYKKLFSELGASVHYSEYEYISNSYNFQSLNFYSIIRDISHLDIAHVFIGKESLSGVPEILPVVVRRDEIFYVVTEVTNGIVLTYNPLSDKVEKMSYSEFASSIDDRILAFDVSIRQPIKRPPIDYLSDWLDNKIGLLLGFIMLLPFLYLYSSWLYSTLYGLSSIGVYLTLLLTSRETGATHQLDRLCDTRFESIQCDALLHSKYSKIFGVFPLSQLGLTYFMCVDFLLFLMYLVEPTTVVPLVLGGLFVVAVGTVVVLFLLQVRMQIFCSLCLLCGVTIGFMMAVSFKRIDYQDTGYVMLTLMTLFVSFLMSFLIRRGLHNNFEMKRLQQSVYLNLSNTQYFRRLLSTSVELEKGLLVNYEQGRSRIDIVVSDTCQFCQNYLQEMLKLLVMSQEYYLSVRMKSTSDLPTKRTWLDSVFTLFSPSYEDEFQFSVEVEGNNFVLEKICANGQDGVGEILTDQLLTYRAPVDRVPKIFYNSQEISQMFDERYIRLNLLLLRYG